MEKAGTGADSMVSPDVSVDGGTASGLGVAAMGDSSPATTEAPNDAAATEGPDPESPGFLERTLNSIRDLF